MISYMDRGTIYPRRLTQWLEQLAAEAGIPTQKKTLIAGGNEAGPYRLPEPVRRSWGFRWPAGICTARR